MCFFRAKEVTSDVGDAQKLVKQILNRSTANRIISRQEAVVLLGGLDLVKCSEKIHCLNVGGGVKITSDGSGGSHDFKQVHMRRKSELEDLSMHEFFHVKENLDVRRDSRNYKVPHWIGICGQPKYPVTDAYAKATITIYKPWRKSSDIDDRHGTRDWQSEFFDFIATDDCPKSVKMAYERVKRRYITKMTHYDPVAKEVDHSKNRVLKKTKI